MPQINSERLLNDLRRFAQFGAYQSGVHRPTFSADDMAARTWLMQKYEEAGLLASIDGAGNVFGRHPGAGRCLLVGSHAESQNHAGWLDGALGVIYGLEIARAFRDSGEAASSGIDAVAWSDEETHFIPFLGSRSFIGDLSEDEIDGAQDRTTGKLLRTALAEAGLTDRARDVINPSRYVGYLEAHIEQGDYLDATGLRVGVVTSIVGIWQYRVRVEGEQNHAGTTRMAVRKDAGVALMRLCSAIEEAFPVAAGPRSVWTVGKVDYDPGAPSIIPGRAEMLFQFRDENPERLNRLEAELERLVTEANRTGPCRVVLELVSKTAPKRMDPHFQDAFEAAAERHAPEKWIRMPSGAGHDAQVLARRLPAAMLFVPSIGGISHHWTENTTDADIVLGCQVLSDAAAAILHGAT